MRRRTWFIIGAYLVMLVVFYPVFLLVMTAALVIGGLFQIPSWATFILVVVWLLVKYVEAVDTLIHDWEKRRSISPTM